MNHITSELKLLRELAKCLQSAWIYGDWKAETVNEREMEKIMTELKYCSPQTPNSGEIKVTTGGNTTVNNSNNPGIKWSVGNSGAVNSYNMFNTRTTTTWNGKSGNWNDNNTGNNHVNEDNTVNDETTMHGCLEEQTPYNVKSNVVTSGKTDDGTIAVIEITIEVKQR
jgi:hypothetical protein